jgi:hypothetical protein
MGLGGLHRGPSLGVTLAQKQRSRVTQRGGRRQGQGEAAGGVKGEAANKAKRSCG